MVVAGGSNRGSSASSAWHWSTELNGFLGLDEIFPNSDFDVPSFVL